MIDINEKPKNWEVCEFQDLLDYIQPTKYIVESTRYEDKYDIPVLTAGKSFIKGYTNEKHGVFENIPVIIFDDFTTASKYVNFQFKVKSSAMKILAPTCKLVNLKFMYYCMKSNQIRSDTHKRYWISVYAKKQLFLPPLAEQSRIVARIEELFYELDKSIESLETAREQLKVYRQALLKHAFEGKLTEQWRRDNADKLETAKQLLIRIQQEREERYMKQLNAWKKAVMNWEVGGEKTKKPAKPRQFEVPDVISPEKLDELAELPVGWEWCKVGHLFDVYVGSTPSRKNSSFWNGTIPWISSGEVAFCHINETNEKITVEGYVNTSTQIHPVGTVMLAMIGEGKTRGQAAILSVEAAHNQNTAAIRVSETNCDISLFYYYLLYQYELTRKLGSGNNQKALNKDRVSNMLFPLSPIDEQFIIVSQVEEKISVVEKIELEIIENINRAEALRRSILKKAISGQLVPQNSNDEPASELLKRIRIEKSKMEERIRMAKADGKKKSSKSKVIVKKRSSIKIKSPEKVA